MVKGHPPERMAAIENRHMVGFSPQKGVYKGNKTQRFRLGTDRGC